MGRVIRVPLPPPDDPFWNQPWNIVPGGFRKAADIERAVLKREEAAKKETPKAGGASSSSDSKTGEKTMIKNRTYGELKPSELEDKRLDMNKAARNFYGAERSAENLKAAKDRMNIHGLRDAMKDVQDNYVLSDAKRDELQDTLVRFVDSSLTDDPELGAALIESFVRRVKERRDLSDDEVFKMNRDERIDTLAAMREKYEGRTDKYRERVGAYLDKVFSGDREAKRILVDESNWPYDSRFAEILFEKARKGELDE